MNKALAYTERLDRALALVTHAFRPVFRKGTGAPYLTHLLMVTALVGEHGGDEDQMIAALLHDYLEDIEGSSSAELEQAFGERVARLVVALSDTVVRPKPPWKQRKVRYIAHLADEPHEVKLISAADKLHNCRSIVRDHRAMGDAIFDRFRPEKHETLWYYREVYTALRVGWRHPILDDLEREIRELHRLSGVGFTG